MTTVSLATVSSGYNLSLINENFVTIQTSLNDDKISVTGGNNVMNQELDMNSFSIINAKTDVTDSTSLLTVGDADARYYNITGDTLTGPMDVNSQIITGLLIPVNASSPVRKDQLDEEAAARVTAVLKEAQARASADAYLQSQITGSVPVEASAFSPISWHAQIINNSVDIPDNVNAWSFGPKMTIESGQTVTIGTGSYWTIADGGL